MIRREPFEFEVLEDGETIEYSLSGSLDEHAKLPDSRPAGKVVIRLGGVTSLNSQGTRLWIGWIQRFRSPIEVVLEDCPVLFVKNFKLVKGFLPEHFVVNSFVLPFYSERTRERRDVLMERGIHYGMNLKMKIPEQQDSAGNVMEVDVIESTYLGFLKAR
ncbi:MAG: hypothetical protein KF799_04450 [Bdellovibrionales bacterium]|nr:hypothetical protein [Bdellovibrionales bacterium]